MLRTTRCTAAEPLKHYKTAAKQLQNTGEANTQAQEWPPLPIGILHNKVVGQNDRVMSASGVEHISIGHWHTHTTGEL